MNVNYWAESTNGRGRPLSKVDRSRSGVTVPKGLVDDLIGR